jgi:membrane associated rhomboid family serine protease
VPHVLFILLLLVVVIGVAYRAMTPEERAGLTRYVMEALGSVRDATARVRADCAPFRDSLRERTPWVVVTPAIAAINATVVGYMLLGDASLADPETLIGWGASVGPRTTNGEWWRLVTAMFVHSGLLALAVNLFGLVRVGLMLERLVGPFAFVTVYLVSGVIASVTGLALYPVAVSAGASGAIFGIYGLLLAVLGSSRFRGSTMTIPVVVLKRLIMPVAAFVVYSLATQHVAMRAEGIGFVVGLISGLVLAHDVDAKPSARRVAGAMGATAVIVLASAIPLRGLADVRPEINLVLAVEDHTRRTYEAAVDKFRKRQMTADALAELIDRGIVPPLQAAQTRIKLLEHVPDEHQGLIASADEYLRLRHESWLLRAEGLRKTNMARLREADRSEQASLNALQRIRAAPAE